MDTALREGRRQFTLVYFGSMLSVPQMIFLHHNKQTLCIPVRLYKAAMFFWACIGFCFELDLSEVIGSLTSGCNKQALYSGTHSFTQYPCSVFYFGSMLSVPQTIFLH